VTYEVGERWEELGKTRSLDVRGVLIRREGHDWERLRSDGRFTRFANTGLHTAQETNWLHNVVAVDANGERIPAGESLVRPLLIFVAALGMVGLIIFMAENRFLSIALRRLMAWR
jgi:hypothetical protein